MTTDLLLKYLSLLSSSVGLTSSSLSVHSPVVWGEGWNIVHCPIQPCMIVTNLSFFYLLLSFQLLSDLLVLLTSTLDRRGTTQSIREGERERERVDSTSKSLMKLDRSPKNSSMLVFLRSKAKNLASSSNFLSISSSCCRRLVASLSARARNSCSHTILHITAREWYRVRFTDLHSCQKLVRSSVWFLVVFQLPTNLLQPLLDVLHLTSQRLIGTWSRDTRISIIITYLRFHYINQIYTHIIQCWKIVV